MLVDQHYAPAHDVRAILESVVGPVGETVRLDALGWGGRWELSGQYRQRPARFVIRHYFIHGGRGLLDGIEIAAPLGNRPVRLSMSFAGTSPGQAPTPLPGNEGALFPHGLVTGTPAEIVRAALDPPTCAVVNGAIGDKGLTVTSDGDWLCSYISLRGGPQGRPRMPTQAELAAGLDVVFMLAGRLTDAFDHQYAAVLQSGGPAAAAEWLSTHGDAHRTATGRARLLTVVVALAGGVAAIALVAVILVAC
jgi:hypothetical protein